LAIVACSLLVACGHGEANSPQGSASARLPDWTGIWVVEGPVGELGTDGYPHASDADWPMLGYGAPYNTQGKAGFDRVDANIDKYLARSKTEIWGYPLMMDGPSPLQFYLTPMETLVINQHREIRHVYTDGRKHPEPGDLWVTTWGDAIGHWEGDTLVVETVAVRQPGAFNLPLPYLSEGATYVERIHRDGPDRIENEITITDPDVLRTPWTFKVGYKRVKDMDRMFHDAFYQNDRTSISGDYFSIDPPADEQPKNGTAAAKP
jgi:hypothetical protein